MRMPGEDTDVVPAVNGAGGTLAISTRPGRSAYSLAQVVR